MTRYVLIGVGLTVTLIAGVYAASPERSLLSSGALALDHADLDCGACHNAFTSFADDEKCLACHEDRALTPASMFAESRCVACHTEHVGEDAELAAVSAGRCHDCHAPDSVHARTPVVLANQLDREPRACLECHGNHAEHRLIPEPALADARAHLAAAHRKGSPLFHKDTCDKCHPDKLSASGASAASVPGVFDPHVTHVVRLEIRCTWCHTTVDIEQHSGTTFRRNVDNRRCVQCHEGEYYE